MPNKDLHYSSWFEHREVDITFEVMDDACTNFRCRHEILFEAVSSGRFMQRRFRWTGSDEFTDLEIDSELDYWGHKIHRLHGPVIREGQYRMYFIDLGKTISAGAREKVNINFELKDLGGTFERFVGVPVSQPLDKVTSNVILPESMSERVSFREYVDEPTMMDIDNEEIDGLICHSGKYQFTKELVNAHNPGHGYKICW